MVGLSRLALSATGAAAAVGSCAAVPFVLDCNPCRALLHGSRRPTLARSARRNDAQAGPPPGVYTSLRGLPRPGGPHSDRAPVPTGTHDWKP